MVPLSRHRYSIRFPLAVAVLAAIVNAGAQNKAPVITMTRDTTARLVGIFLAGTSTSDDGLPTGSSVSIRWKQIAPDTSVAKSYIYDEAADTTRISFPALGDYTFQVSATDGQLTSYDTLTVHVVQNLGFYVTAPKAGDSIQMGVEYVIGWIRDPMGGAQIYASFDQGRAWVNLTSTGAVGLDGIASTFPWLVDTVDQNSAKLPDKCPALLKICDYGTGCSISTPVVPIVLVKHAPNRANPRVLTRTGGYGAVTLDLRGNIRLPATVAGAAMRLYRCNGRFVLAAAAGPGGTVPSASIGGNGVLVYSLKAPARTVRSGLLVAR